MILTELGWLVVHALWQGALIAGLAGLVLGFMRRARANSRYLVASGGLILMLAAPVLTMLAGLRLRRALGPQLMPALGSIVNVPATVYWGSVIVPIAGALWLAGVAAGVTVIAREIRRARDLRWRALTDAGEGVQRAVRELGAHLAVPGKVAVRASRIAAVPMVLGWRRPVILLPEGAASELRPTQVRSILAHELAHVRRRDFAANVVQTAIDTLLFFHPGARWLSRQVRSEREYCCDDVAVSVVNDAADYARALAALEDARPDCRLAVAAAAGTLLDRVERIIGRPRRVLTPVRGVLRLLMAVGLAAILFGFAVLVPPGLPFGTKVQARSPWPGPGAPPVSSRALPRAR